MKSKIGVITLGVRDIARSLAFYRDGLGFPTHNYKEGGDHVLFVMEGSWLALYPADKLAEDAPVPVEGFGFRRFTLAHLAKSKAEVDKIYAQAIAAGAKKHPQDAFWGGYSGYFADPDGCLWEVAFNPFFDLS
jgi:catechol 2,3-dioxygenase-like lactoylglutathione lyase family enzyme